MVRSVSHGCREKANLTAARIVSLGDDNPEWTAAMFAKAWPAEAVLSPEVLAAFKRPRGRPPKSTPKAGVAVRLDPDAVARLYRTKNERA